MAGRIILLRKDVFRRSDHFFDAVVKFVHASQFFQVFPVSFNQVEFRTIRRQPDHQKTMFKQAQGSLDRSTFVVRNIIHHQNDATRRIALHQEILEKLQERVAVLPSADFPGDRIGVPRIRSQDMTMLLGPRLQGWNDLLLSLFHPTGM